MHKLWWKLSVKWHNLTHYFENKRAAILASRVTRLVEEALDAEIEGAKPVKFKISHYSRWVPLDCTSPVVKDKEIK